MMKNAGFKILNLSLGSTSKKQLKNFRRHDVRASFEKALLLAQKHDLESVSYIIAGAPGQSAQSSLKDLLYLAQKNTLIGLSIYYPAPGSLDYKLCKDKNILPEHFSLMRSSALPLNDTTSRIQAVTLLRLARIVNFIKSLKKSNDTISAPEPVPDFFLDDIVESTDRLEISKKLLQYFLYDGKIRGVNSDGKIYSHIIDIDLTLQFIKQLKPIEIVSA